MDDRGKQELLRVKKNNNKAQGTNKKRSLASSISGRQSPKYQEKHNINTTDKSSSEGNIILETMDDRDKQELLRIKKNQRAKRRKKKLKMSYKIDSSRQYKKLLLQDYRSKCKIEAQIKRSECIGGVIKYHVYVEFCQDFMTFSSSDIDNIISKSDDQQYTEVEFPERWRINNNILDKSKEDTNECLYKKDCNLQFNDAVLTTSLQEVNLSNCNEPIRLMCRLKPRLKPCPLNNIKERIPKGRDNLYYMENNTIHCIQIVSERMDSIRFKHLFPNASKAFVPNTNVHAIPKDGRGVLTVLHFSHGKYVLAVLVKGNANGGEFLIYNCLGQEKKKDLEINDSIYKHWKMEYVNFNEVQGCYVNQVYGDTLDVYSCPNISYQSKYYFFTMSTNGPDLMRLPSQKIMTTLNISTSKRYNVIYCLDHRPDQRIECVKSPTISIPLDKCEVIFGGYSIVEFVDLQIADIEELPSRSSVEHFFELIIKKSKVQPYKRLVPPQNSATRIKLVNSDEFEILKMCNEVIIMDEFTYVVGTTEDVAMKHDHDAGTLVSTIGIDNRIHSIVKNIDFNTIHTFHRVYGKIGYKRKTCHHLGFGTYRGHRNTKRPHPTPFVETSDIPNHQYHNSTDNTFLLAQPFTEQIIGKLGENAMLFGNDEYPQLFDLIDNSCTKSILTCGSPGHIIKQSCLSKNATNFLKTKENLNNSYLSFSSTKHVDLCDRLYEGVLSEEFVNSSTDKSTNRMYERLGASMPTTCQYHHVWKDVHESIGNKVCCYFVYHGLGIAQPLHNYCSIFFLGSTFSHSTSLCYLINKISRTVILRNDTNDVFVLMAWGRTGGAKDYIRRLKQKGKM